MSHLLSNLAAIAIWLLFLGGIASVACAPWFARRRRDDRHTPQSRTERARR